MGLRSFKPTSEGKRAAILPDFSEITKKKPEKSLLRSLRKHGGRNNTGRVTTRHRGGGHRRRYRVVDFYRNRPGENATVLAIEYDPNRSARLALLQYGDGAKAYILAPEGVTVGQELAAGDAAPIENGNAVALAQCPTGTFVHNIELRPGRGAQMCRAAGAVAQVMAHEETGYTQLRLPSGEVRRVRSECLAVIGQVGNIDHKNQKLGKAGRARHMGLRPEVRGSAMSPRDHPHGGGEGRSGIGLPGPKTPWGKPALGHRTRNNKSTDKFIVRRRYQT
ncbi:MAG: 50S ribosomal protein L2 [Chloroflexi bacterium]|nr:50S ribosomal protein L2 [Chloroflexota bacterium]